MAGTGIMVGVCTSHTHPHTQLKKSGNPIPISIPNQSGDSPSKRGRVRAIATETCLFAISISHPPPNASNKSWLL